MPYPGESEISLQFSFAFLKQSKVTSRVLFKKADQFLPRMHYNFNTGLLETQLEFTPGFSHLIKGDGTYRQNKNAVHLVFSEYRIDAIVRGNRMEGTITLAGSRENFVSSKTSEGRSNSSASTIAPAPAPIPTVRPPSRNLDGQQKAKRLLEEAGNLVGKKQYREALEKYTMALSLNPNEASTYKKRGLVRHILQDYRGAIEDYDKYLSVRFDSSVYVLRGNAKFELQDYRGAVTDYDRVIRSESRIRAEQKANTGPGFNLALVKELTDSQLAAVYNNRGFAKERMGDKTGACEDFRVSCTLGHDVACKNILKICGQ